MARRPLPPWLGWTLFPLGWTAWASFAYAGMRARQPRWLAAAAGYLAAAALSIGLTGIVGVGSGDAGHGAAEDVGTAIGLIAWATAIVHGLKIKDEAMRRIELRGEAEEALGRRRLARELARERPAAARALGIGDVGHPSGLIDLNSAAAETLATLPGIDAALAERMVRAREQLGGFSSVEDLGLALDLPGDLVERLRERAIFVRGG